MSDFIGRRKLRESRIKKNYTQYYVAEAVGISRNFYNQVEKGKRNPRLDTAFKISDLLEVDVNEWR
ncbi:helix-turn-helix transcriptional regulator [Peribacillus aracenensis]|uniref:helix-turn-helix transcriptional regulator n=1 Tax=Peribacillus aracenensis TaxID=2976708 RepID=UPI0021A5D7E7|nr:helix-turn-helix transcriptional regulator [Peribacillus sp. BBB004]